MITREDFAINLASNDRNAEQFGWQKGTRSELSISKYFASINGAKQECNELFFNQRYEVCIRFTRSFDGGDILIRRWDVDFFS